VGEVEGAQVVVEGEEDAGVLVVPVLTMATDGTISAVNPM
jgi:hypothetical protein